MSIWQRLSNPLAPSEGDDYDDVEGSDRAVFGQYKVHVDVHQSRAVPSYVYGSMYRSDAIRVAKAHRGRGKTVTVIDEESPDVVWQSENGR